MPALPSATAVGAATGAAADPAENAAATLEDPDLQRAIEASLNPVPASSGGGAGGVGWSHLVKMGYAATGPTLGSSPPLGALSVGAPPAGAWGDKRGSIVPSATTTSAWPTTLGAAARAPTASAWGAGPSSSLRAGQAIAKAEAPAGEANDSKASKPNAAAAASKGKSKGTLLFTTSQRKY